MGPTNSHLSSISLFLRTFLSSTNPYLTSSAYSHFLLLHNVDLPGAHLVLCDFTRNNDHSALAPFANGSFLPLNQPEAQAATVTGIYGTHLKGNFGL